MAATSVSYGQDFPALEGPYMGQPVPGMTAEVFAPGMREFYFTTKANFALILPAA